MTGEAVKALAVVVLGGVGTWMMLPHRHGSARPRSLHAIGAVLVVLATGLLLGFCSPPGAALASLFFYAFAAASVLGGVLTITSVNPVHSALWFAAVVLATTGLFLMTGAQFLAAATVIIYAGAIIVTFLFVIMLAQASGEALYDRTARAPGRATLSCFLLLWALLYAILAVGHPAEGEGRRVAADPLVPTGRLFEATGRTRPIEVAAVLRQAVPERAKLPVREEVLLPGTPPRHVAALGATLFTDHLISVQVAGVLLFIALVGAAAIATPKAPVRPSGHRAN